MTPVFGRRSGFLAAGVLTAWLVVAGLLTPGAAAAAPLAATPSTSPAPVGITTPGPLGQLTSSTSSPSRAAAPTTSASTTAGPALTVDGPQLSITVDNGRTSAQPGEVLDYVLTLTNLGSADIKGLRVTQSVPSGLALVKADGGGRAKGGNVGWDVDLRAAKVAIFHITMKVSATPKDVLRLATVACATLPDRSSPIVCASHSDQLPAGAAAVAAASAITPTSAVASGPVVAAATKSTSHQVVWWVIGAGVLIGVVIAILVIVRRRRSTAVAHQQSDLRGPEQGCGEAVFGV